MSTREQGEIFTAVLNGTYGVDTESAANVDEPTTRLPAPNTSQGTSQGAMRPPSGVEVFTEFLHSAIRGTPMR